uniref:Uncharacterized protein LOC104211179 n=1 Tax=Nicotiana sylvestris TaxID=4096 RepID=A0A1U7UQW6_NICSY|nr:PREDICTED: uncharacterized protein LOC104211179 [Nicotiana sylvestris]
MAGEITQRLHKFILTEEEKEAVAIEFPDIQASMKNVKSGSKDSQREYWNGSLKNGDVLYAYGSPIPFVGKAIIAEAWAIRKAIQPAVKYGWKNIDILSVSLTMV